MLAATAEKKPKRIRGPHLRAWVRTGCAFPSEVGIIKADDRNLVIASNKRLSENFAKYQNQIISRGLPCWVGTMAGYEERGKKFGRTIEYVDDKTGHRWVFPVPKKFRGKANAILVAEHPDYTLEVDGKNRVVHTTKADLVEQFPGSNGWYKGDPKHDIPQGRKLRSTNEDARYLFRLKKRVGLIVRGHAFEYDMRVIEIDKSPSEGYGVVVEAIKANEQESFCPLMEGQWGDCKPQKLQVESGDEGLLVKGFTLEAFRELVGDASAELEAVLTKRRPERLVAIQRLLQSLKE